MVPDLEMVAFTPEMEGEFAGFDALVSGADGDFEGLVRRGVDFDEIAIDGFFPGGGLWTVEGAGGAYGFVTHSLTPQTLSPRIVALTGTGMFMAPGYDDTPGRWSFTADQASAEANFSFSSTAETVVPERTTLGISGVGLLGLSVLRGRERAA